MNKFTRKSFERKGTCEQDVAPLTMDVEACVKSVLGRSVSHCL